MKFINPFRLFVGSFVPNWLLSQPSISQGAKLTYARLAQYAGSNGVAWPNQESLSEELGVKPRQLRTYLQELESASLIHVTQRGLGKPNEYRFLAHAWMREPDRQDTATPDRQYSAGPERQDTATPLEENQRRESIPPSFPPRGKPTESEAVAYFGTLGEGSGIEDAARDFWDYFQSNGWKVGGKAPMKDWQSAARRWFREAKARGKIHARVPAQPLTRPPTPKVSSEDKQELRKQLRMRPGVERLLNSITGNEPESWRHSNELHKIGE